MNDEALGQFLMQVFIPSVPIVAGAVIALSLALVVIVLIRRFAP